MFKYVFLVSLFWVFQIGVVNNATAQLIKEPKANNKDWKKSFEPFRIVGNLYYVGTYDLACYLIATSEGNILINTGLASSEKQIKKSIKILGFNFLDTKILLNTQAHFDHTGAMAAIKKQTNAKLFLNQKDAKVMMDGGNSDYAIGGKGYSFMPVVPDKLLQNNDTITLGEMKLVMLHHPGHTQGSSSYLFTVKDEIKAYKVLIANMPTIVTEKSFSDIKDYPIISSDYASTIKAMKTISFDLWLASHASQFKLHEKHKPGNTYNPNAFSDQLGYDRALNELQNQYEMKVNK